MSNKLRILAAGDIHGDSALCEKLAQRAVKENVDLVILAGDITMFERSTKNIIGPFAKVEKKVLLIPGNHDNLSTIDFLSELYPNAKNIHGYGMKVGDLGIVGVGGTTKSGPFSRISEHNMYELLRKGFGYINDAKVKMMITHEHPSNSNMQRFSNGVPGSDSIEKIIAKFQPDFALCAHLHEAWGMEEKIGKTLLINVGREGKIFEIN